MKEYYSIGETAKLFDLSVQTLRFYEKMDLIAPDYVNPDTHYRYYSPRQFHYIDRIQYLKKLGLSLKEIRDILKSGQVDELLFFLRKNLDERQAELEKMQETVADIQWYIRYFEYMDGSRPEGQVYVAHFEERNMLTAPCAPYEPFADIEVRLTKLKSREEFKDLDYRRQYGFLLDFEDMMHQHFAPTAASIYLKSKPGFVSPYVTTLPAGDYLCFAAQLRLDQWDSAEVQAFFEKGSYKPVFAVANEYEDNLVEYTATPYEVQVYLGASG
ncbi:helix-turn-helix domain-containing protein [Ruminococcaceae bacterium OttesenSCG-928-D13]|nr:helix-turn-helix domain-containing protein [Ruminococcaceae bacterium OttesenSCG-928-D13]